MATAIPARMKKTQDRPRSCHIMPTAAPKVITTPIAMKYDMRPNTTPIGPYFWS